MSIYAKALSVILMVTLVGSVLALPRKVEALGTNPKKVRLIYLVPSGNAVNFNYSSAVNNAGRSLQSWYQTQMGNSKTFTVNSPEVFITSHSANWYSTNPSGSNPDYYFWNNAISDAIALAGAQFNDPNNIWALYIDADPACNQITGGTQGIALLPANDLRGLHGSPLVKCPGVNYGNETVNRYIGGLGHELGHAFGLPHPAGCESGLPSCPSGTLMWLGYQDYPNAYLTQEDKNNLNTNSFFQVENLNPPSDTQAPTVSILSPSNGSLVRINFPTVVLAQAADNVGVSRVELYANATLVCSKTAAPYSCPWTPRVKGNTYLSAKAYDAAGNVKTSSLILVRVY